MGPVAPYIYKTRNQYHYVDFITVQLKKWRDYEERGLLKKYRSELELDALRDAACFVQLLVLRFDQPPFSLFQLESEFIRQYIPDHKCDPYLSDCPGILALLLDGLYRPMDIADFHGFIIEVGKLFV